MAMQQLQEASGHWIGMALGIVKGFQTPQGSGRVGWGKGKGWDFHTLAKPLPLEKVKGIYNDKNICIYHIYLLLNKYFSV